MKWCGKSPLVIGLVGDDNLPEKEIIVYPGQEIPEEGLRLLREAGNNIIEVPRFGDEPYTPELVKNRIEGQ